MVTGARGRGIDPSEDAVARRRMWLNAGAVTLGVGAAMVAGAAVAAADTGADAGPSAGHSTSSAARGHASSPAKSTSARGVAARSTASTRSAVPARSSASIIRITAPAATARHIPGATALAAASTTAVANAQPVALATPTPNKLLQGLAEFGHNVFLTVKDQFSGAKANLAVLGEDLRTVLGFSRVTITVPAPYGDPGKNEQYYVPMADYQTAPLATVAMAYGQLTDAEPDLASFITAAKDTPSLANPGHNIYEGPGSWVVPSDSYELLLDKNVRVITRYYYEDQQSKAISDLADGLQDPTKVMIAQLTGPSDGQTEPGWKTVIVLGLDTASGVVTINDPTQASGKGLQMNVDDFVSQWSDQKLQLVTAQLSSASSTPLPEPATKLTWALPAPNEIGKNLAQLVVHQIEGLQSNIGQLAYDLGYAFGLSNPDIPPPAPQSNEYGNYTRNYPYYYYQGTYDSCVLMATAAIIGQLNGGPVPPGLGEQILQQAMTTPSEVEVGQVMFYKDGGKVEGHHWGTYYKDAVKLLNMNGMNADYASYLGDQGNLALDFMTAALDQNQGVMVAVASNVVQNAYTRKYFGKDWKKPDDGGVRSDHAVVVISVDMTKEVVYINDSAWENGQGLPIPLDQFMSAWEYSDYSMVTAEKKT